MSKIKCGQKKCKYNNCEYCMKSGIYVDAHANCDSYEEGKKENNIVCNATNCKYNCDKNCSVDHLNINKERNKDAKCVDFEEKY